MLPICEKNVVARCCAIICRGISDARSALAFFIFRIWRVEEILISFHAQFLLVAKFEFTRIKKIALKNLVDNNQTTD